MASHSQNDHKYFSFLVLFSAGDEATSRFDLPFYQAYGADGLFRRRYVQQVAATHAFDEELELVVRAAQRRYVAADVVLGLEALAQAGMEWG